MSRPLKKRTLPPLVMLRKTRRGKWFANMCSKTRLLMFFFKVFIIFTLQSYLKSKCWYWSHRKTSHTTLNTNLNIKILFICLYNAYNKCKVQVVPMACFLHTVQYSINILFWENSRHLVIVGEAWGREAGGFLLPLASLLRGLQDIMEERAGRNYMLTFPWKGLKKYT